MADKDEVFGGFIDNLDKPQKPPKKTGFLSGLFSKKEKASKERASADSDGYYDESMDFLASDDSGNAYGDSSSSSDSADGEEFVPKLSNLFGFKWWEFAVIVIEFVLIVYMALVLLKIVPLF